MYPERIIVREDSTLVAEIYSMATAESSEMCERYNSLGIHFVTELLNEAVFAHLMPASMQQSAAAPERQFDFVADLITKLVAASAELTVVLKAALSAMLEVGCAAGIRWLRQQYCTTENTADVIDSALLQLHERSKYRNVDVVPLSAASLEALLADGEADRVLTVHSIWWRTKDEWLARRGPIDHHDAHCCESARVILAAAGTGAESLLVGTSWGGLLRDAISTGNSQQLAVLLSDTTLARAVLTAECLEEASALHYAVELCCDGSIWAQPSSSGLRACIEVIVKAAHAANCLCDILSVQDEEGVSAATWLLRTGYSDFVALLPADSSLKVTLVHTQRCCRY
jgi:hypothetical protein